MNIITKKSGYQTVAMILMIILSVIIIILRVRKMIHLRMAGEDSVMLDWFMLLMWLIVLLHNAMEVVRRKYKKPDDVNHKGVQGDIS